MGRMKTKYRYELHLHTSETSPCGQVPGARGASLYAEAGYDAICVTDHYYRHVADRLPGRSAAERAASWMSGYRAAQEEGARIGIEVLLGMELRFDGSQNDYLVFGMDEQLLVDHPDLYQLDPEHFRALADEQGLLVVQAHPYRPGCTPADPVWMDGIETWNGNPRHDSRNDCAEALATRHPRLLRVAGSDFHQPGDVASAAMLSDRLVRDSAGLAALLRSGGLRIA